MEFTISKYKGHILQIIISLYSLTLLTLFILMNLISIKKKNSLYKIILKKKLNCFTQQKKKFSFNLEFKLKINYLCNIHKLIFLKKIFLYGVFE